MSRFFRGRHGYWDWGQRVCAFGRQLFQIVFRGHLFDIFSELQGSERAQAPSCSFISSVYQSHPRWERYVSVTMTGLHRAKQFNDHSLQPNLMKPLSFSNWPSHTLLKRLISCIYVKFLVRSGPSERRKWQMQRPQQLTLWMHRW